VVVGVQSSGGTSAGITYIDFRRIVLHEGHSCTVICNGGEDAGSSNRQLHTQVVQGFPACRGYSLSTRTSSARTHLEPVCVSGDEGPPLRKEMLHSFRPGSPSAVAGVSARPAGGIYRDELNDPGLWSRYANRKRCRLKIFLPSRRVGHVTFAFLPKQYQQVESKPSIAWLKHRLCLCRTHSTEPSRR